jgi:quercetin dioxygenase-like cupin family protein
MPTADATRTPSNERGARRCGPTVSLLHDSPDVRVVLFEFGPGAAMPLHSIPSSVTLTVVHGSGVVTCLGEPRGLSAGRSVAFAPHEAHGIEAEGEAFAVLATIAPSQRTR